MTETSEIQASDEQAPSLRPEEASSQETAAAIIGALAVAGTQLLFGVPGGGANLDIVGAAADAGMEFLLTHDETAAAIMAATYADLTGAPGAMVATRGPGLTSAATGIAHALLDRLPLVAIVDTVPVGDRDRIGHQRLDQVALGRSIAKATVTVGARHRSVAAMHAVALATAPPMGPVVVNCDPGADELPNAAVEPIPETGDLGLLREALSAARRPVVMLGLGALSHASAVRESLVGSGLPVLQTYRVRGIIPDSSAEAAGLLTGGTMESPLLRRADLVVGLGVDPVELIPARWDYAARSLLVSETPTEAESYFAPGIELIAHLPRALALLREHAGRYNWPPEAGRAAKQATVELLRQAPPAIAGKLTPQDVVATVRSATSRDAIATVDAGAHMLVAMPLWEVDEPHLLLISSGLATMGFALPAAIAAALCHPETPVVAFTGDGGLGMTLMEIETAVRRRLRVIVIVFNDTTLSLIKIKQRADRQGGDWAVSYGPSDFAGAALAMGAAGERVVDVSGLAAAVREALGREGPTVIDVPIDPTDYPAILDLTRGDSGRLASRH